MGKGYGVLHEVPSLTDTTAPLTAFSATALQPQDVASLIARAFAIFSSERPRPVHIAIPADVLEMPAGGDWQALGMPARRAPTAKEIERACELLRAAEQPMTCVGVEPGWRAIQSPNSPADRRFKSLSRSEKRDHVKSAGGWRLEETPVGLTRRGKVEAAAVSIFHLCALQSLVCSTPQW
jgi:hypothetical protein